MSYVFSSSYIYIQFICWYINVSTRARHHNMYTPGKLSEDWKRNCANVSSSSSSSCRSIHLIYSNARRDCLVCRVKPTHMKEFFSHILRYIFCKHWNFSSLLRGCQIPQGQFTLIYFICYMANNACGIYEQRTKHVQSTLIRSLLSTK